MTIAYDANIDNANNIEIVMRRYSCITPQNRSIVMSTWGLLVCKWLALPKATVHYNFHMNGVDINDQLCSYYSTQLWTVQNWMPLFFWLLGMAIINAFLICHEVYPYSNIKWTKNHRWFRIQLAHNLVNAGAKSTNPQWFGVHQNEVNPCSKGRYCPGATLQGNSTESRAHGYVGKRYELPAGRKIGGPHRLVRVEPKGKCHQCTLYSYLSKWEPSSELGELFQSGGEDGTGPQGKTRQTSFMCECCRVSLCKQFVMINSAH
jgi:hypothetical protein